MGVKARELWLPMQEITTPFFFTLDQTSSCTNTCKVWSDLNGRGSLVVVFILCFEPDSCRFPSKFLIRFQCKISNLMSFFLLFFFIPLKLYSPIIFKNQLSDRGIKVSLQSKCAVEGKNRDRSEISVLQWSILFKYCKHLPGFYNVKFHICFNS